MTYVILEFLILIKCLCLINTKYTFQNITILSNNRLTSNHKGIIFPKYNPNTFYLNKENNIILINPKNISHFSKKLNFYKNFKFYEQHKEKINIMPSSDNNIMHLYLLENNENEYFDELCKNEIIFDKNQKILKILYIDENIFAILFENKVLKIFELNNTLYQITRNLLINDDNSNCILNQIMRVNNVKDIYDLTNINKFMTLDYYGKIDFYNLQNYYMNRFSKYEIIKSLQLGFYENYYFSEIGPYNRFLLVGYNNKMTLIGLSRIKIIKIYLLNEDEKIKSILTLDNYQVLLGTNKGNIHLISVTKSTLNFDGSINICKNKNIDLMKQEKINKLICIKCGTFFKLIDLNGKFSGDIYDEGKILKEVISLLIGLLILLVIKYFKQKKENQY